MCVHLLMNQLSRSDSGLVTFYDLARRTRSGVLDWLDTLPHEVFVGQHDNFGHGSLRAVYEHIADTYLWWTGSVGLGRPETEIHVEDVAGLREAFAQVDATVPEALETFDSLDEPIGWNAALNKTSGLTQRWLILHPVTHEFHHKGQALALARVLGYPHPGKPDTDLVDP